MLLNPLLICHSKYSFHPLQFIVCKRIVRLFLAWLGIWFGKSSQLSGLLSIWHWILILTSDCDRLWGLRIGCFVWMSPECLRQWFCNWYNDLNTLFKDCHKITNIRISTWQTRKVQHLFVEALTLLLSVCALFGVFSDNSAARSRSKQGRAGSHSS